jgi:hypothetical protein
MELATVCVYDFFSWYALTKGYKTKKNTMRLNDKHPSRDHLKVVKRNDPVIPCISYLEIPDTKSFGGLQIESDLSHIDSNNPILKYMEEYAKSVATLFCPFFDIQQMAGSEYNHAPILPNVTR